MLLKLTVDYFSINYNKNTTTVFPSSINRLPTCKQQNLRQLQFKLVKVQIQFTIHRLQLVQYIIPQKQPLLRLILARPLLCKQVDQQRLWFKQQDQRLPWCKQASLLILCIIRRQLLRLRSTQQSQPLLHLTRQPRLQFKQAKQLLR